MGFFWVLLASFRNNDRHRCGLHIAWRSHGSLEPRALDREAFQSCITNRADLPHPSAGSVNERCPGTYDCSSDSQGLPGIRRPASPAPRNEGVVSAVLFGLGLGPGPGPGAAPKCFEHCVGKALGPGIFEGHVGILRVVQVPEPQHGTSVTALRKCIQRVQLAPVTRTGSSCSCPTSARRT